MSLTVLQIAADARWVGTSLPPLRRFGVPEGGPFDRESCAWCLALAHAAVALEVGPFGASFRCEAQISVAIIGAERAIRVDERRLGSGLWTLAPGSTLTLGPVTRGARTYLAPYASPHRRGTSGGTPESLMRTRCPRSQRGDVVPGSVASHEVPLGRPAQSLSINTIRVVPGPRASWFDVQAFVDAPWSVSMEADRVGIRLMGAMIEATCETGEIPSEPQVAGAIQVTRGGTPIIIGPDGPTIGGYPVIAVVIDADRDKLGQVVPNNPVRFSLVDLDTARRLSTDYRARLRDALTMRFQPSQGS